MTVKSSEVLRLAAEYALESKQFPMTKAYRTLGGPWDKFLDIREKLLDVGYHRSRYGEERCMTLCLAAAIAEDAGD